MKTKTTPALQYNIDASQRELDYRAAIGEDVSNLKVCLKTGNIISAIENKETT